MPGPLIVSFPDLGLNLGTTAPAGLLTPHNLTLRAPEG